MAKSNINKTTDIDKIKDKIFSDVSMMSGIKVKGVDTESNKLILKYKVGKTTVTTGSDKTIIVSNPRFIPIWIWDIIFDRTKTKKVHNKVVQIVMSA